MVVWVAMLAAVFVGAGCAGTRPLKGGVAVTKLPGTVEQSIIQSEKLAR
jgi:hypothetical protein